MSCQCSGSELTFLAANVVTRGRPLFLPPQPSDSIDPVQSLCPTSPKEVRGCKGGIYQFRVSDCS